MSGSHGEAGKMGKRPVIFFDWDGTLGDSMDLCLGEIRLALKRVGHEEVSEDKIRACNGPTHEESIGILGLSPEEGPAFLRERIRSEQELIPVLLKVYPGVPQALHRLMHFADLAIVSNGQEDYIRSSVAVFGLTDCFVRIQAAIPGQGKSKTLADMIRIMEPSASCMVGDRRTDIKAGLDNHLPTMAVTYGYGEPWEWEGATVLADSVEAMTEKLEAWAAAHNG